MVTTLRSGALPASMAAAAASTALDAQVLGTQGLPTWSEDGS